VRSRFLEFSDRSMRASREKQTLSTHLKCTVETLAVAEPSLCTLVGEYEEQHIGKRDP